MRSIFVLLLLSFSLNAQDEYHSSLIIDLKEKYGLENGEFIMPETEAENLNVSFFYGNINITEEAISDQSFSLNRNIQVIAAGTNAWDAGIGIDNNRSISDDDLILVTFWAKKRSGNSQVFAFAEDAISFEKEYYLPIEFTQDWTQYFIAFKASKNFNLERMKFGFHLATQPQDIDLAGFTAINFKNNYEIGDLPTSFSPFNYDGRELDAPWRELADIRIEDIRKSDVTVIVRDKNGMPVTDAIVRTEMQQHDFGFGSALVTCRFPGNNCYDATYVDKVLDLDGEGHGFNECVNENALKWRGWEEEWLGTPEETVSAFEWLTDKGITMRGHNLVWPGAQYLPDDINDNLNNIDYLRNRLDGRIEEMINHPELSKVVRDWDVLNEITTNRTLESSFNNDISLGGGRKIYNEIFSKVKELDPDLELYINDYMAISSGATNLVNRYKSFLDELQDDDVPFDGIGFQCHIGSVPNSIPQVEQIYNEFYQRYGKRMKVTEYDINPAVDEATQADYMRDILTLTFSHPGMDAFIMWGFWDGNHWKGNAPMFYEDWTLKPSGEVFIEKVFNEWWTDETKMTLSNGTVTFRPFKGKHKITVTKNGKTEEIIIDLDQEKEVEVIMDGITSTKDNLDEIIKLHPNPSPHGDFRISIPANYSDVCLTIIDSNGRMVAEYEDVRNNDLISSHLPANNYQVLIDNGDKLFVRSLIIF